MKKLHLVGHFMLALGFLTAAEASQTLEQNYLERDFLFVTSPEIDGYVTTVVDKLWQTRTDAGSKPRVLLYCADQFVAFVDTGGNLLISTQTLRDMQSEDEMAALLAHELAHVVHRHVQNKSAVQTFTSEIDTIGTLTDRNPQNASLFWSDLLSPTFNRTQEREADATGYEMLRAAGYDGAAFSTMLTRLGAAQMQRSQRMEALRQKVIQRASEPVKPQGSGVLDQELAAMGTTLKTEASTQAINTVFNTYANTVRDYDTPEQRQTLIAPANTPVAKKKEKRSPRFAETLRKGPGGALLNQDSAAFSTTAALQTGDVKAAKAAVTALLPRPASPHLNLAVMLWYEQEKNLTLADERAAEWLTSPQAPAVAFLKRASYQSAGAQQGPALQTLEQGVQRIGAAPVFLPDMITISRAANDDARAEGYARQCHQEGVARTSFLRKAAKAVTQKGAPSPLYLECVARLGREPTGIDQSSGLLSAPTRAGSKLIKRIGSRLNGGQ